MSYPHRIVLNFPLDDSCYAMDHHHAPSMSAQHSNNSTKSNWSHSSAGSYQSQASSQRHGNSRHPLSAQETMQHSSVDSLYGQISVSQHRGVPTSPSDKSDGDSKEKKYCPHPDCRDEYGRPARPFTRQADVARHIKSTHEKNHIDCPYPRCNRKGLNGFTRADHLTEHKRGYHGAELPKRQNSQGGNLRQGH